LKAVARLLLIKLDCPRYTD